LRGPHRDGPLLVVRGGIQADSQLSYRVAGFKSGVAPGRSAADVTRVGAGDVASRALVGDRAGAVAGGRFTHSRTTCRGMAGWLKPT